jgi:hypothetical protein
MVSFEKLRSAFLLGTLVTAALAAQTEGVARAQDKQACVSAYEDAQHMRKDGRLTDARAKLLVCAQEGCPHVVRKDCTVWVTEVEQATPTVLLAARGPSGKDVVDVSVSVDGKPITRRLDGKPIPLDPGPHSFHFELAGAPPRDETVLLQEGERNRQILADFHLGAGRTPAIESSGGAPMKGAPTPLGTYVLGGIGLAGLGVFGTFAGLGMAGKHTLDDCKPNCAQSDVDAVKLKFLVADIGLGVGVASLIVATVIYFTKGEVLAKEAKVQVDVMPTHGGSALGLRGSF